MNIRTMSYIGSYPNPPPPLPLPSTEHIQPQHNKEKQTALLSSATTEDTKNRTTKQGLNTMGATLHVLSIVCVKSSPVNNIQLLTYVEVDIECY